MGGTRGWTMFSTANASFSDLNTVQSFRLYLEEEQYVKLQLNHFQEVKNEKYSNTLLFCPMLSHATLA